VLLTVPEVAKLLRACKATVYNLIARETLLSVRVSNSIRMRRDTVEVLLRPL
jgi:excisionase family DNA binding protein